MSEIKIRRAYEEKGKEDGYRILIDRLWPRGLKKEELSYSWWAKEIPPSDKLRKSFHDSNDGFKEFKKSYKEELENNGKADEFLNKIESQLKKHNGPLFMDLKIKSTITL